MLALPVLLGLLAAAPHEVASDDTPLSHEEHPEAAEAPRDIGPWPYVVGVGASLASGAIGVSSVVGGVWLATEHPELSRPILAASLALPVLLTAPLTAAGVAFFDPGMALLAGFAAPFAAIAGSAVLGLALWVPSLLIAAVTAPGIAVGLHPQLGLEGSLLVVVGGFYLGYVIAPLTALLLSTTVSPGFLTVRLLEEAE